MTFTTELFVNGTNYHANAFEEDINIAAVVESSIRNHIANAGDPVKKIIACEIVSNPEGYEDPIKATGIWLVTKDIELSDIGDLMIGGLLPIKADGSFHAIGAGTIKAVVYLYDVASGRVSGGTHQAFDWSAHDLSITQHHIEKGVEAAGLIPNSF